MSAILSLSDLHICYPLVCLSISVAHNRPAVCSSFVKELVLDHPLGFLSRNTSGAQASFRTQSLQSYTKMAVDLEFDLNITLIKPLLTPIIPNTKHKEKLIVTLLPPCFVVCILVFAFLFSCLMF